MDSQKIVYITWLFIVFSILGLGYAYIGWRLIHPAQLRSPWNMVAYTTLAVMMLMAVFMMMFGRWELTGGVRNAFSWIAYTSLGIISFVFTLLLLRDTVIVGGWGLSKLWHLFASAPPETLADESRRLFLFQATNVGMLGASALLTGYGVYEARKKAGYQTTLNPHSRPASGIGGAPDCPDHRYSCGFDG